MSQSVVPALIDALVATAGALTGAGQPLEGVHVFDGVGITDDPGDYLMVGVSDPDDDGEPEAAAVTQQQMAFGVTRPRHEQGLLHMSVRSVNGDAGAKAARDAVFAIQEALASALRTTDSLGVTGVMSLGNGSNMRLLQDQNDFGAVATLLYDIAFEAEI